MDNTFPWSAVDAGSNPAHATLHLCVILFTGQTLWRHILHWFLSLSLALESAACLYTCTYSESGLSKLEKVNSESLVSVE